MHHPTTSTLDCWKHFMADVPSPDSFIEMAFYGMISSALQRRVYQGSDTWSIFPNLYIILVGPPATGKGLAIFPTKDILTSFKATKLRAAGKEGDNEAQLEAIEALAKEYIDAAAGKKLSSFDAIKKKEPLIIPVAAQASTYEALVKAHSESLRSFIPDTPNELCKGGLYSHSSLALICEEISSLFRKHTEDLVNYLIAAFDNRDYEYDNISRGSQMVKNPCLNLIGGTQPNFLDRVFSQQLLTEGFSSRTIFVYEEGPRFVRFEIPPPTDEQKLSYVRVKNHVEKLTKLFGRVHLSEECHEYMRHKVEQDWSKNRINLSPKLEFYHGRKAIHFRKLTTAIHFADSTEMVIQRESAEKAAEVLDRIEKKMDKALSSGGRNQMVPVYEKVVKFVRLKESASKIDVWTTFVDDFASEKEVDECISFLMASGKVRQREGKLII